MQNGKVSINLFKSFYSFILLVSILSANFAPAAAQTRKSVTRKVSGNSQGLKKVPVEKSSAACNGGWSGIINFEETLDESGEKDDGGGGFRKWSHNISYEGKIIVDGSDPKLAAANTTIAFTDVRRQQEKSVTKGQCGAWNPEHDFVVDHKQNDTETGSGAGAAQSYNLYLDEARGTYNLSFRFPNVSGRWKRDDLTTRSGHCQPKNNEPINADDSRDTTVDGRIGRIENQKINPNTPDYLQGSVTIDENDKTRPDAVRQPVTTISWRLRRCPPPVIVADIKFYHPRYPSPNTWEEILEDEYTIDGNDVKIVATIINFSGEQKSATVNFKEMKENADLPEGQVAVNLQPHEEKKVEYVWDTSGYAWHDAEPWNKSEIFRKIEVKIPTDQKYAILEVRPKPVVLVPGLWSKPDAFAKLDGYFKSDKLTPWATVVAPVYPTKTAADNASVINKTVRELQEKENAWHVDLVAHSTGGLMARAYVDGQMPTQYDGRPTAAHLVMLGTPNMGTPCASGVDNIITRIFNRNPAAFGELSHKNMRVFNEKIKLRHGTKFSILVGNSVAPICQLDAPGDGITPNASAIWTIRDWKYSTVKARHEDMPGEQANFMQVYKWLAISPKGNHAPDNAQAYNRGDSRNNSADSLENFAAARNYGAMFRPASFTQNFFTPSAMAFGADEPEPNFATGIKLAANQSSELEIPVTNGSRFSLVLYAAPKVSAILLDEKGEIAGKISEENAAAFRTITVKKPLADGKWRLRLESREQMETEILITAFIDYHSTVFEIK